MTFLWQDNLRFIGHDINVTGVWENNITGRGVVVSVIDDGKQEIYFQLTGKVVVVAGGGRFPYKSDRHDTHVPIRWVKICDLVWHRMLKVNMEFCLSKPRKCY